MITNWFGFFTVLIWTGRMFYQAGKPPSQLILKIAFKRCYPHNAYFGEPPVYIRDNTSSKVVKLGPKV